jgi:hypothetical protein
MHILSKEHAMLSSYCNFDPLKEIWLGDVYPSEFFDQCDNLKNLDAIKLINDTTLEDLAQIETVLRSLGIKVSRPKFTGAASDYMDSNGNLLKPPITPRDETMMLGSFLYHLRNVYAIDPWQDHIDRYRQTNCVITSPHMAGLGHIVPPSIVRLGRDIFIDKDSHEHCWDDVVKYCLPIWQSDFRVHVCHTGGHSDSVFCALAPGKIITSHWKPDLSQEFPGWDILKLPWRPIKAEEIYFSGNFEKNWYIDDPSMMVKITAFNSSIDDFALQWIGTSLETVYEVNSLVINPNLIITTGQPPETVKTRLKTWGVDYIPVNFRTKGFWDSGIHCLTVDVDRIHVAKDLFPDLQQTLIYHGQPL